jgi:hypothetical protein
MSTHSDQATEALDSARRELAGMVAAASPAMDAVSTTRRGLTPGELTAFLGHMKSLFGAQAGLVNADAKRLRVLLNRLLPHEDTP